MLTIQEVEMLANLLARCGINQYEAMWANTILEKLRADALSKARQEEDKKSSSPE